MEDKLSQNYIQVTLNVRVDRNKKNKKQTYHESHSNI